MICSLLPSSTHSQNSRMTHGFLIILNVTSVWKTRMMTVPTRCWEESRLKGIQVRLMKQTRTSSPVIPLTSQPTNVLSQRCQPSPCRCYPGHLLTNPPEVQAFPGAWTRPWPFAIVMKRCRTRLNSCQVSITVHRLAVVLPPHAVLLLHQPVTLWVPTLPGGGGVRAPVPCEDSLRR